MQVCTTVSAGYVLTRWIDRPDYLDDSFPARMISASDFVAPVLPAVPAGWLEAADVPHGRFAGYADAAQGKLLWALSADLERIGLDSSGSADLAEVLAAATARGDFESPSTFTSLDAVRRVLRNVGRPPHGIAVLGLELPEELADAVLAADGGISGFARLPLGRTAPESGGEELGWDVYRPYGGELHSWMVESAARGIRPDASDGTNAHGLLPTLEAATRVARRLEGPDGGERWFPFRLTLYSL